LTVINKNIVRAEHFESVLGVSRLTASGRRLFLQQFEQRLNTEIEHPVFQYKATYRRCLELQARLLAKHVLGELAEYRPFQVR
jgi:CRISPR-associated protein Cas1